MKIAIVGDISKPISRNSFGGTEIWTYNFVEELIKRQHEVTLFSNSESTTGKLVPICSKKDLTSADGKFSRRKITMYTIDQMLKVLSDENEFDIIHVSLFSFYYALPFTQYSSKPIIITVHGYGDFVYQDMEEIFKKFPRAHFVYPSHAFTKNWPTPRNNTTIHHGVRTEKFDAESRPQDYFLWIGRICPEKGLEDAIAFAEKTNSQLLIAGSIDSETFFDSKIKPHLNKKIQYLGVLNEEQKIKYYSEAKALLFTSMIPEAFGLVIAESIASGTPVISYDVDPVSEIIEQNKTGFIVPKGDVQGLIDASKKIGEIDRKKCREDATEKFDFQKMVDSYEKLYEGIING